MTVDAPATLSTKQVCTLAGLTYPSRSCYYTMERLGFNHLKVGSGHAARWSVQEAMTLAFVRAFLPARDKHPQRMEVYLEAARDAAAIVALGGAVGWIVVTAETTQTWYDDEAAALAEWLLVPRGGVQVLRCAPIIDRLERALAEID